MDSPKNSAPDGVKDNALKVLIIGGNPQYHTMFKGAGFEVTADINKANVVCFTGGEDVNPALYGELALPQTFFNPMRDMVEEQIWKGISHNPAVLKVGICRGAQFLNVMNGGKLWQHVDGHAVYGGHKAFDNMTGDEILVSSTHHQMLRPTAEATLLAYAHEATVKYCDGEQRRVLIKGDDDDVEACWYEATRTLCFQPHPEFDGFPECREYFFKLLKERL